MALIKGKQIAGSSLALSKLQTQDPNEILIGDANGDLQAVNLSGDATLVSDGTLTVSDNAINSDKILNSAITFSKLNSDAISDDLSVSATSTQLARADAAKSYSDARYTAATQYADSVAQGLDVKASVRVATTAPAVLASDFENGDTIDGIVLATGDRVLVKDQADASENGIYIVAASGAPSRANDADQGDLTGGAFIFVEEGTANADNGFVCTNNGSPQIDTDDIAFAQFSGAGSVSAGAALSKVGNQLDVEVDDLGIEIVADQLRLKDLGVSTAKLADAAVTADKLAAAIAGEGISGAAGTALAVDLNQLTDAVIDLNTDSIIFVAATDNATRKESAADFATALAGAGVTATDGQLTAARLTATNQFEAASATTNDEDSSGIQIDSDPSGMIQVFVNGVMVELKSDKTGDSYFSHDGGTTPRSIANVVSDDTLYWNGSNAGYQLEASDKITLVYETA